MGLDYVELIMAVEEEFKIDIDERSAGDLWAGGVGAMYLLVLEELGPAHVEQLRRVQWLLAPGPSEGTHESFRRTRAVFYRLRQGLMETLGLPRRSIRPDTELADLLPPNSLPASWKNLERATSLNLPALRRRAGEMVMQFLALALVWIFVAAMSYVWIDRWQAFWPTCGIGWAVLAMLVVRKNRGRSRFELPMAHLRMRDLTHEVEDPKWYESPRRRPLPRSSEPFAALDDDPVWQRLRQVIVRELCVKPERVTPVADWKYDLGAGQRWADGRAPLAWRRREAARGRGGGIRG